MASGITTSAPGPPIPCKKSLASPLVLGVLGT